MFSKAELDGMQVAFIRTRDDKLSSGKFLTCRDLGWEGLLKGLDIGKMVLKEAHRISLSYLFGLNT